MSSAVARSSKYSYRASSTGVGAANDVNVNIEYSADLSALSRLEVRMSARIKKNMRKKMEKSAKKWKVLHNLKKKKSQRKSAKKINVFVLHISRIKSVFYKMIWMLRGNCVEE